MMHAYTKPEAEAPQTATEVLADDLHSAVAFENLRDTVQLQQAELSRQQRQIELLARATTEMLKAQNVLSANLVEMATRVSELTGVLTGKAAAIAAIGGAQ